jgi:hypothetical protein
MMPLSSEKAVSSRGPVWPASTRPWDTRQYPASGALVRHTDQHRRVYQIAITTGKEKNHFEGDTFVKIGYLIGMNRKILFTNSYDYIR